MAKSDYIDQTDAGFSTQLNTCKDALPGYSAVLGVSAASVVSQAHDADYFAYSINAQTVVQNSAGSSLPGKTSSAMAGRLLPPARPWLPPCRRPSPPWLPASSCGSAPSSATSNPAVGYNPAIGIALGIEGSDQAGPDLATIAPKLTVTLIGGHVEFDWGRQGFGANLDMIEIQVNRGAGYALLTCDTTPGYTAPLPAAPAKWSYKAIYRVGDSQTGQWSAETSVTVGGFLQAIIVISGRLAVGSSTTCWRCCGANC